MPRGIVMLMCERLFGLQPCKSLILMANGLLMFPLVIALAGCAGEGAGGIDPNSGLAHAEDGEEDPVITMTPTDTGVTAQVRWEPPPDFGAAGYEFYYGKRSSADGTSGDNISSEDDVNSDTPDAQGPPSCTHGEKQTVDGPQATIDGLEPDTQYFFVIRAFNEDQSETLCSNEITVETTPTQS